MIKANCKFVTILCKTTPKKSDKFKIVIATDRDSRVMEAELLEGEIVSVGEEVKHLKKGDKVLFDAHKTIEYPIGKNVYRFVNYETIYCSL